MLDLYTCTIKMMFAYGILRVPVKSIAGDQAVKNLIVLGYFVTHHNSDSFGRQGIAPKLDVVHHTAVHHARVRAWLTFRNTTNKDARLSSIANRKISCVRASCGPVDEKINMLRTGCDDNRNMIPLIPPHSHG